MARPARRSACSLSSRNFLALSSICTILRERLEGQHAHAAQQADNDCDAEGVAKLAHLADPKKRQDQQQQGCCLWNDHGTDHFLIALEILEKLEQKEEIPFRPGRVCLGGIGGRIEVSTAAIATGVGNTIPEAAFRCWRIPR